MRNERHLHPDYCLANIIHYILNRHRLALQSLAQDIKSKLDSCFSRDDIFGGWSGFDPKITPQLWLSGGERRGAYSIAYR